MEKNRLRVLLVDDDEDDYIITRDLMSEIDEMSFDLEWVATYNAAVEAIGRGVHDVYLVDYGLGGRNGLDLLREVLHKGCRAPIILLTGQGDHEIDMEAMKAGAADYLVKGQIAAPLLGRSIRYSIERTQVIDALRDSEKQYKRLFNNNPLPMWLYDVDTLAFLAVNDAATRSYGYSRKEFLGMSIKDIALEEDLARLLQTITQGIFERGLTSKSRHKRKDGMIIDVEITSHEVSFAGRSARLVMANDITERKRMEDALRRSEEHFRSLIENAQDQIEILDANGTTLYSSPAAEKTTGYKPEEIVGRSVFDHIHPDDIPNVMEALEKLVANPGVAIAMEVRIRHKDGSWRVFETIGTKPADDSIVGGIIVNSRDVTERKLLQEQLIQSEKLAALGRLVSGVAHELNNPLTSVIGYTQLVLAQYELAPDLRERLDVVNKQGQRARRIVQNMLSFARQHRPQRSGVDLNSLLEMTLELRAYELGVVNIQVAREFGDVPSIIGDAHLLQQVFLNIMVNAEQALRQSNKGGHLTVRTESKEVEENKWAVVTIIDDGPGIPPEVIGRIFDPFFTTKEVGEGTGLGLSISYGIVKEHGGGIKVESRPGQGTTFLIELPSEPPMQVEQSAEIVGHTHTVQ
jgi:two-component system cell cycle sensor histidine kinase/response regulator CckA